MLLARRRLRTLRTAPTSPSPYRVPCASPSARPLPCTQSARWAAAGGMCPYMFGRSPPAPPARCAFLPCWPSPLRRAPARTEPRGAGLQHPSPTRAREGAAYLIACGLPLKTKPPTLPSPHPSPRPHTRDIAKGKGGEEEWGRAEEPLLEEPGRSLLAWSGAGLMIAQWHQGKVGIKHLLAAPQTMGVLVPQPLPKASVGSLHHPQMSLCWAQEGWPQI